MKKLTLDDLEVRGQQVLVRVDFNVPLQRNADGQMVVADPTRIRAATPTINAIARAGGKAILISHLGRPRGKVDAALSLAPVAQCTSQELQMPVHFCPATVGEEARAAVRALPDGGVVLLENTRFDPGETRNASSFAAALAALGDLFVNDAFGTAHRAHASNVGVALRMRQAAAGYLLQQELAELRRITVDPARPVVALVGGAKVSDKIGVLGALASSSDALLVGGAMSYTLLKAQGYSIGHSLVEDDRLSDAAGIIAVAGSKLHLPSDHVTSTAFGNVENRAIHVGDVPDDRLGLDLGPATAAAYRRAIMEASTVVWNGPMGVFEQPAFAAGTLAMARAIADVTRRGATTVVGGGDSVRALRQSGLDREVTHVSTGGGAMLTFLEGGALPGVEALTSRV